MGESIRQFASVTGLYDRVEMVANLDSIPGVPGASETHSCLSSECPRVISSLLVSSSKTDFRAKSFCTIADG